MPASRKRTKKTTPPVTHTNTVEPTEQKMSEPEATVVVESTVTEPTVVVESTETETPVPLDETIKTDFLNLLEKIQLLKTTLSDVSQEVKGLQKRLTREVKLLVKKQKKVKKNREKRKPSGFAKPTRISSELCNFLKLEGGTLLARTQVTKKLNEYIKANNLQNPSDKRIILLNKPLRKLLNVPKGEQVSYFNLQRWIKPHFIKETSS